MPEARGRIQPSAGCRPANGAATAVLLIVLLSCCRDAQAQGGRTIRLAKLAETYEWELRGYAPYPSTRGFPCDETVGRFCLRYAAGDSAELRSPGPALIQARQDLLEALAAAASTTPHDTLVSGRLVRVLIEAGRPALAIGAARTFAAADPADPWSYLLLGFALDASGHYAAAERVFGDVESRLTPVERSRMENVSWLLAPPERERYGELTPAEREDYRTRLWRAADPIYLTSANEARVEHFARYVYTRLLEIDAGKRRLPRWGEDLEELTRRFGVPVGSTERGCLWDGRLGRRPTAVDRAWIEMQTGFDSCEGRLEPLAGYYDPDQRIYVPPVFSEEPLPDRPDPGSTEWFYGPLATYHGFHPTSVRAMRPLDHQLARFSEGDSTILRADVEFGLDDVAPANGPVELGLFVLDSTLQIMTEDRDTVQALGRVASGWLQTNLPRNTFAYSVEARDLLSRQTARARYVLPDPPAGDLSVSDPVLVETRAERPVRSDPSFHPFGSLLLDPDRPLSLYLEATGLQAGADGRVHYRVELRVAKGREGGEQSSALVWTEHAEPAERVPILVDLGRLPVGSGLYRLIVTVRDETSGWGATGKRVLKFR